MHLQLFQICFCTLKMSLSEQFYPVGLKTLRYVDPLSQGNHKQNFEMTHSHLWYSSLLKYYFSNLILTDANHKKERSKKIKIPSSEDINSGEWIFYGGEFGSVLHISIRIFMLTVIFLLLYSVFLLWIRGKSRVWTPEESFWTRIFDSLRCDWDFRMTHT